ncbi:hypothetical protein D3C84_1115330 [compost metagenome]
MNSVFSSRRVASSSGNVACFISCRDWRKASWGRAKKRWAIFLAAARHCSPSSKASLAMPQFTASLPSRPLPSRSRLAARA